MKSSIGKFAAAAPGVIPGAVVLLCAVYLIAQMRPGQHDGPYALHLLGLTPVSSEGRVKPLDTVARASLLAISGRQELTHEGDNGLEKLTAMQWLTDVATKSDAAEQYKVFRIDHPDVLQLIGQTEGGRHRFAFADLMPHLRTLGEQAHLALQQKPGNRNAYQKHVVELWKHVNLYFELWNSRKPYSVPPVREGEEWMPFAVAFEQYHATGETNVAARQLSAVFAAYMEEDAAAFNSSLAQYLTFLDFQMPDDLARARFEVFFNHFQPFKHGTALYVLALLLGAASLWGLGSGATWARVLWQTAILIIALTFVVHTFGLISRMYLQGRWGVFVTNLYSSAVFIGWFCVIIGLICELYFRNGIGSLAASISGFVTLIIAHNLAAGDTMQMMQAVLDSNFWLATHVTVVTIGYSATFVAGLVGIAFILGGVLTRYLTKPRVQALGRMIYGTVAFALLFSFVGTVLGGIWADQSWGRFWGWDPKENGAVLIVLMMALILHARWGGMIRERGMAVLAVGGNIITAWSWFGTNMLGIGLHAYGFMESAVFWLLVFVFSQLAVMAVGLLPLSLWRSFSTPGAVDRSPAVRTAADPLAV
jgi:ABC-type transport system involved in cytochrome c biogenesis permease subunit